MLPYIIPVILIILGILRTQSKIVLGLLLIYMWALMGLNSYTPDWETYELTYEHFFLAYAEGYEIGFAGLCALGNLLGLSYQQFRMLYALIYVFFIFLAAVRLTKHHNLLLVLFLVWPCVPNVSGLRQSLANMVVCSGIPFLFSTNRKQLIYYVIFVFLGSLIHQSVWFYVLLVCFRNELTQKQKRILYIVVGFMSYVIGSTSFFAGLSLVAGNEKLDKWLNMTSDATVDHLSFIGFIVQSFFVVAFVFVINRICISINPFRYSLNEKQKQKITVIRNLSIVLLLTIPGYVVSAEYQRFLYGVLIIFYALYADYEQGEIIPKKNVNPQTTFMFVIMILLTAGYYMMSMKSHEVLATFKDNLLF